MPDDFLTEFIKQQSGKTNPVERERSAIERGAKTLGIDPVDYATAISYETAGTFSPTQPGPRTKWGQHRGTIQYGEPQWKKYRVTEDFEDQVTRSNVEYLRQAGVRPGMTFKQIYAAINGGSVNKDLSTLDADTGRTIADNIRLAERDHRRKAMERYGWSGGEARVDFTTEFIKSQASSPSAPPAPSDDFATSFIQQQQEATAPVPESPQTIEAQVNSTIDSASPKAATLLTDANQIRLLDPALISGLKRIKTRQGVLLVNPVKAQAMGVTDYAKDFATLIGKVEDVGDATNTGTALKTTGPDGTELSSSIVTTPETAAEQAALDRAAFPQAARQEIKPAEGVAAERIAETGMEPARPIADPIHGVSSAREKYGNPPNEPQPGDVYKAWLAKQRLADDRGNREVFAEVQQAEAGKTDLSQFNTPPNAATPRAAKREPVLPVQASVGGAIAPRAATTFDRQVGKFNHNLDTEIGTTEVDAKLAPAEKLRTAMNSQLGRFRVTPQEIDEHIAKYPNELKGITPNIDKIAVAFRVLRDIKGDEFAKDAISNEQSQDRVNPNVGIDLQVGRDWVKEDAEWLKETIGETPAQAVGVILGGGGDTAKSLAGIARYVPLMQVPVGEKSQATLMQEWADSISESTDALRYQTKGDGGVVSQVVRLADPSMWGRFVLLSRLPGGAVTAMGVDSGTVTAGSKGSTNTDVLKAASKAVAIGLVFKGGAYVGGKVGSYATAKAGNVTQIIGEKAGQVVGAMTGAKAASKGYSYVTGDPDTSDHDALMAGAFQLYGTFRNAVVGKRIRLTRNAENGKKSDDVVITPEGELKLLKGQEGKPDVEMYVDVAKGPDAIYRAAGDTGPIRQKEQRIGEERMLEAPPVRGNPLQQPEPSQTPTPLPTSGTEAVRIPQPDAGAVQKASIDTRVRKVADAMAGKDFVSVDELAKATRMNKVNVEDAALTLYGAGRAEMLPDGRIRLISEAPAPNLFERAQNYGQTPPVPSQPAPMDATPLVQDQTTSAQTTRPEPAASDKVAVEPISQDQGVGESYKDKTVTDPVSRERWTFTGEVAENNPNVLIAKNNFGRDRRVSISKADELLSTPATSASVPEIPTETAKSTEISTPTVQNRPTVVKERDDSDLDVFNFGTVNPAITPTAKTPEVKAAAKNRSLSQFVRSMGGIKWSDDVWKGEIRRVSNKEMRTTGLINNKSGLSLDDMAYRAVEAGYLPERDMDAFIQALEQDASGAKKHYAPEYYADLQDEIEKSYDAAYEKDIANLAEMVKNKDVSAILAGIESRGAITDDERSQIASKFTEYGIDPAGVDAFVSELTDRKGTVGEAGTAAETGEVSTESVFGDAYEPEGDVDLSFDPSTFEDNLIPSKASGVVAERVFAPATDFRDFKKKINVIETFLAGDKQYREYIEGGVPSEHQSDRNKLIERAEIANDAVVRRGATLFDVSESEFIDIVNEYEIDKKGVRSQLTPKEKEADQSSPTHTPPQEMTPLMTARVRYDLEQKKTPSDIAQRYNLTPEQVASVEKLPPVGQGGQISHKIIQSFVPSKTATPEEFADKVARTNDLISELGLPTESRVTRDSPPKEIKTAIDAVRLAIAKEQGFGRASEMAPGDWLKWLDNHADKLEQDTVTTILEAIGFQVEHNESKVAPFVSDPRLARLFEQLDGSYGIERIKDLQTVPNKDLRDKIYQLGYEYGLKQTAIQRAYQRAREEFLNTLQNSPIVGGPDGRRGDGAAESTQESSAKGSRQAEELEVRFNQESTTRSRDIARRIRGVKRLPNLDKLAKFEVNEGELVYKNPAAGAVFQEIVAHVRGRSADGVTGLYGWGNYPQQLIAAAQELYGDKIADKIRQAINPKGRPDLVITPGFGPKGTAQEEYAHRFIRRSGLAETLNDDPEDLAGTLDSAYRDLTVRDIKDEKFAKSLRDDAVAELRISKKEARANRRKMYEAAKAANLDLNNFADGVETISRRGEALAKYVRRKLSGNESSPIAGDGGPYGSDVPGSGEVRGSGIRESRRSTRTDSDQLAGLRRADLLGASRQGNLEGRDNVRLISPVERHYIQKKAKGDAELIQAVEDEVRFARTAPTTQTQTRDLILDVLSVPKSFKSSVDLSAAGRQGWITSVAHPVIAARSFGKQIQSLASAKRYEKFKRDLDLHPAIELAEESGLFLATLANENSLTEREESFMSRVMGQNPYFKNKGAELTRKALTFHVRASERAYLTYLDNLRINAFAELAKQLIRSNRNKGQTATKEQYEGLARWINYSTGRGDLGQFNNAAQVLNAVAFSPRWWVSRLQVLNPVFYGALPPGARGIVMRELGKFLGGMAAIALIMKAAGFDVEFDDPNDPNVMKLKLGGYSYSIDAALMKHLRYVWRMAAATGDKGATRKMSYLTERYVRSSLAPVPGGAWSGLEGKNYIGEPTSFQEEAIQLFTPISAGSFKEAIEADGTAGLIKTMPEFFGIGVTRFRDSEEIMLEIEKEVKNLNAPGASKAEMEESRRRIKLWMNLQNRARKFVAEDRKQASQAK